MTVVRSKFIRSWIALGSTVTIKKNKFLRIVKMVWKILEKRLVECLTKHGSVEFVFDKFDYSGLLHPLSHMATKSVLHAFLFCASLVMMF